ncbi:PKD domain-containing protein [bacterium]|nr:PKD domain-containing protein [bacterium]
MAVILVCAASRADSAGNVAFSRPGGFFTGTLSITISVDSASAQIRYTTNDTLPTNTSPLYTQPLSVPVARTIHARAFEAGREPGPIVRHSYYTTPPAALTSSPLPIVVIDTRGQAVKDEPKITAYMGIISNGPGRRNAVTDPFWLHEGVVGIEVRGQSSQLEPQKQYGIETRSINGAEEIVSLFGFPEESDWILYAPYNDKTLMRNVLAYDWSNRMGRYASRTVFCELVLNGDYRGVYVLMEKIKRDKGRVNIAPLGADQNDEPAVSGGYIVKIDKIDAVDRYFHTDEGTRLVHVYPRGDQITVTQQMWIRACFTNFEAALRSPSFADPATGYAAHIDVDSFVDTYILVELCKNIDGLRISTYLFKDRGGKIVSGPAWDYNISLGNGNYLDAWKTNGWYTGVVGGELSAPFWWQRLLQDAGFVARCRARWTALRKDAGDVSNALARIDAIAAALNEPQQRHFQRWPILGAYVWPNWFIGQTYAQEVAFMKQWLTGRIGWIDGQWQPMIARFVADQTCVLAGTSVKFTDLSIGAPNRWAWQFGATPPQCCTLSSPSFVYDSTGIYTVSLCISNNAGSFGWRTDTVALTNYITVMPEPAVAAAIVAALCALAPHRFS